MRWKFENPDHVIARLLAEDLTAPTEETDPIVVCVATLLRKSTKVPDEVRYAYEIFKDKWQREVIEAFLLAGSTPQVLEGVLGVPVEVTNVFSKVFFDVDVFRNRLDVESYARSYPESHDAGFGKQLKLTAVEMGLNYLCAAYGKGIYKLPHLELLEDAVAQAYVFSKVPMSMSRNSLAVKEARQWNTNLVNAVREIPKVRDSASGDKNELLIKLRLVQDTPGADDPIDLSDVIFDNGSSFDDQ